MGGGAARRRCPTDRFAQNRRPYSSPVLVDRKRKYERRLRSMRCPDQCPFLSAVSATDGASIFSPFFYDKARDKARDKGRRSRCFQPPDASKPFRTDSD
jgi:hypothetical protein